MKLTLLSATALAGSLMLSPAVAFAQTTPSNQTTPTPTPAPKDEEATPAQESSTEILVTGSRIFRPTETSQVPLTSVTVDELVSGGDVSIGDSLNDLPALRSTYGQSNSTRFIGTSGLNILDLRGLGVSRTLVLVNGRRHITASPGDYLVDVNTIPMDLLERVDIVTGGSSAIYGSDAVAGVVNFVLKDSFDGLKVAGQGAISSRGDRGSGYVSAVAGKNFADGRGNIAVAAEYAHTTPLYFTERDFMTGAYSGRTQWNTQEPIAGEPAAGDGVPDNGFFTGVRNGNISNTGYLTGVCSAAFAADRTRCLGYAADGTTLLSQRYMFTNDGRLLVDPATLDFRQTTNGASTNVIGGRGSTLRDTGMLSPLNDRITVNLLAHFSVSDAFEPFLEAKYVRNKVNQEGQPSFIQSGVLATFSCSNPFLQAQALTTLQTAGRCATPASTFALGRFNVDFGGRGELQTRETYRAVAGIRGTFNDDWHYELSANYGEFKAHLKSLNNLLLTDTAGNFDGYLLAIDAVLAPAGYAGSNYALNAAGQKVVCRVNADASATNDRANCVPLNLFGYGLEDPRALAFSQTTTTRDSKASQFVVSGFVSGDLSQAFELPGGPVAFAIGGEYRRETAYEAYDALVQSGATFLNAIQPFAPPAMDVKEAYGEIQIPLLKDVPFFKELTLSGAARVSDYNTSTGTTYSYNAGAVWAPFDSLRFRGNFARAVRAPTQSDLYSTPSENFASIQDPCDVLYINNGPNRAANCAAAGVPTGFINTPARSATLAYLSGGNAALEAERSDSYTFGFVFKPKFVPGLSLAVDYYDITVNNLIATLGAQTILNQCFDGSSLNNPYCGLIFPRAADSTFADPAVLSAPVNFAKQKTSGIDIDLNYFHKFESGDTLNTHLIASWVKTRVNYINPVDPTFGDTTLGELGDPRFEFRLNADYTTGFFGVHYSMQFLDKMMVNGIAYETMNSFQGRAATNADAYPFKKFNVYTYHNLRFDFEVSKNYKFYIGMDNVFDVLPPYGLLGNGAGDAIYDNVGRYMYAGFRANF